MPVFLLHGTPGSRSGPKPRGIVLYRMGVRLICYDRPGYGGSDRHEGRRVADVAGDVAAIADHLGFDRFAVVGRSGGGPHALACAALLPDRVTRAAAMVSIAPADASDLDWHQDMTNLNTEEYRSVDADGSAYAAQLAARARVTRKNPRSLVEHLRPALCDMDHRVIDDIAIRRQLTASYREATRPGPGGWIDDVTAFRKGWGFDLSTIRVPVRLWHGDADTFSPVQHTEWLAARIPGAEMQVQRGAGHFTAVEFLPLILAWLAEARPATVDSGRPGDGSTPEAPSEWVRVQHPVHQLPVL
ncbi:alpha/beta hydrolase [Phytohabitans sp. ZYX-F-186]|uniref:Alpha/beta hydrolase n=1 Tax=Phytohabitans maris TaxID=3071409 RepID=A0ABU0Z866_9ACTN|nr:alpha/beta hydrolase [Phytohabitans sp. ZYX-F-186]MDQ7903250.1 alpha/beta hydrolase [Phytohabitans sp. ZYX-F-186]